MDRPEIVHPVDVSAAEPWMRTVVTTLLGDPFSADFDVRVQRRRRSWRPERTWGVRERGRWVGTLATERRVLTVPGVGTATHDLVADAVTGVSVSATHRRRGLLTQMITQSLRAAKQRGDAVSALIAAEYPIYGHFGYAPATTAARYVYRSRRPGARVDGDPGRVRQVDLAELHDIAPGVFDAARRLRPGQIDRPWPWWPMQLGTDDFTLLDDFRANWFVHGGADGPDGLLAWRTSRDFSLSGRLGAVEVSHLVAATDDAYRNLWAYLGGLDAVDEIGLTLRPADEPVRWLLPDARSLDQTEVVDHLWLRLLDVPAALTARGYARDGRVVLDVEDDAPGRYGSGRVALTVEVGRADCVPTADPADLTLSQRTLASIYLGTHRLHSLMVTGDVREKTPGSAALVDLMFSTPLVAWNATAF